MSQKWSWLVRRFGMGDTVTVTVDQRNLHFEAKDRVWRTKAPSPSSVARLADDMLGADEKTRAAILLHYTYWPSMIQAVLTEVQARTGKKKREERAAMRCVRRRVLLDEKKQAPHSNHTPAIIAFPNGTVTGGYEVPLSARLQLPPHVPRPVPHPPPRDDDDDAMGPPSPDDFSPLMAYFDGMDDGHEMDEGEEEDGAVDDGDDSDVFPPTPSPDSGSIPPESEKSDGSADEIE